MTTTSVSASSSSGSSGLQIVTIVIVAILILAVIGLSIWLGIVSSQNSHGTATGTGTSTGTSLTGFDVKFANLSGANETPPNSSAATGQGGVMVNRTTKEITGGMTFTGITPTAAHIHQAASGFAGPIIIPLTIVDNNTAVIPIGTILTPSQYTALLEGQLYYNVHSAAFPNGEIRGQLTGVGTGGSSLLTGSQVVPPVVTASAGRGTIVVDPTSLKIMTAVVNTTAIVSPISAHIHEAAAGSNGPTVITMTINGSIITAPAGATLTSSQYTSLINGNLYFDVHTTLNPSGEIRGQIIVA